MRIPNFLLSTAAALTIATTAFAGDQYIDDTGFAVSGYDVVAYFTVGEPTRGSEDLEYVWRDVRWRFSSVEHKIAFEADPTKYAPRYGGYCAGGMALGRRAPIDPEAFVIVDGKLYLNFNKSTAEDFRATTEESIAKADDNWERMNKR